MTFTFPLGGASFRTVGGRRLHSRAKYFQKATLRSRQSARAQNILCHGQLSDSTRSLVRVRLAWSEGSRTGRLPGFMIVQD